MNLLYRLLCLSDHLLTFASLFGLVVLNDFTIDQSINQLIYQSINQLIYQSINQLIYVGEQEKPLVPQLLAITHR